MMGFNGLPRRNHELLLITEAFKELMFNGSILRGMENDGLTLGKRVEARGVELGFGFFIPKSKPSQILNF